MREFDIPFLAQHRAPACATFHQSALSEQDEEQDIEHESVHRVKIDKSPQNTETKGVKEGRRYVEHYLYHGKCVVCQLLGSLVVPQPCFR